MPIKMEDVEPVIRQARGYYSRFPIYAPVVDNGGQAYNVKAYGAKGDGVTDDLAAINAAITAASPTAGTVYFPAGTYVVSDTIRISPALSSTNDVTVPSLVAESVGGRIGDVADEGSQVTIKPSSSFIQGHLLIDYVARGDAYALTGSIIRGFELLCGTVSAGIRISNPRRFRVADITIDHPALPVIPGNAFGAVGGFNVCQQSPTATAYNIFDNISVSYSAQDGFYHGAADNGRYMNCFDLNATRYGFNAQGFAVYVGCHYEGEQYGVNVVCGGNYNYFFGLEAFGGATINAVRLTNSGSVIPAKFIGCYLYNQPGATPGEQNGSIVNVIGSGLPIYAEFVGCTLRATTNTTDLVYGETGLQAGSNISFTACDVIGSVTNKLYNDASGNKSINFLGCSGVPNTILKLGAATTTAASLNVASGVAPTSPADGDMWYDGSNVKIRVGGTTKTFTIT